MEQVGYSRDQHCIGGHYVALVFFEFHGQHPARGQTRFPEKTRFPNETGPAGVGTRRTQSHGAALNKTMKHDARAQVRSGFNAGTNI